MKEKILEILGSIRFWMITLAWLAVYVGNVEQNGFILSDLFNNLAGLLGTVAGVGTLDKFGKYISKTE